LFSDRLIVVAELLYYKLEAWMYFTHTKRVKANRLKKARK